jgi:hypothetical protein
MTDINKYDKNTLKEYWAFINQLAYDCETQDAYAAKYSIMKKLSPSTSETYKEITDSLAFSLYREVYSDKKNSYLYACYDAISKGQKFYEDCWLYPEIIKPLEARLTTDVILEQNFSNVFPIEDDFYSPIEDVLDTCEYDSSQDFSKLNNKYTKGSWKDFNDIDND